MQKGTRYPSDEQESRGKSLRARFLRAKKEEEAYNPSEMPAIPELGADFVVKAKAGDRETEERILERLRPILHTYFIKRVGLKPEVEDLIQNTLLRVHNGFKDLEYPERFMGFVMKAALYELHDLYRGRYSGREDLFDPALPPGNRVTEATTGSALDAEKALSVLTPKARRILELKEYGYRYKEIAEMIDSSEAAVKMQVKRAFERMRRLLVA